MAQLYRQAERKYGRYTGPRSPNGFLVQFQGELDRRLSALWEALAPCRTERTAAVCNRIGIDLKPDEVLGAMEQANRELLARYALPELETYLGHIQYEKDDPSQFEEGLLKWAAMVFIRYGYDLLPAINRLEQDATERLRLFERDLEACASRTIHQHLIAPIQSKLPSCGSCWTRTEKEFPDMRERTFTCYICGRSLPHSQHTDFDGQELCLHYLEEHTILCSECGARL